MEQQETKEKREISEDNEPIRRMAGFGSDLNDIFGKEKSGKCQCGRNLTPSGWCHRCSKFTRK